MFMVLRTSSAKGSVMDLNLVVLAGRIAAEPEIRTFDSGATLMRLLVTVRSDQPRRRLDVIPVVQWNPDPDDLPGGSVRGRAVWIAGAVQRRFWSVGDGRTSRIEIVAHEITIRDEESSFTDDAATAS
jgi:single-stranded DNA-binding protein